jgi:hypothetical protein
LPKLPQIGVGTAKQFKIPETNTAGLGLLYKRKLPKAQGHLGADAERFCNGYREEREDSKLG